MCGSGPQQHFHMLPATQKCPLLPQALSYVLFSSSRKTLDGTTPKPSVLGAQNAPPPLLKRLNMHTGHSFTAVCVRCCAAAATCVCCPMVHDHVPGCAPRIYSRACNLTLQPQATGHAMCQLAVPHGSAGECPHCISPTRRYLDLQGIAITGCTYTLTTCTTCMVQALQCNSTLFCMCSSR